MWAEGGRGSAMEWQPRSGQQGVGDSSWGAISVGLGMLTPTPQPGHRAVVPISFTLATSLILRAP